MVAFLLLGAAAYPVLLVHDFASHNGHRLLGYSIFTAGCAMLVVSYIMLWRSTPVWAIPDAVRVVGFVLASVFFLLMLYSLLIEIPFRRIYLDDQQGIQVIDTGTYALCRHPGVLWFGLFLIFTFVAGGRPQQLAAAALWSLMDAMYAVCQERFFYPRIFGEQFERYRSHVPMVVPTTRSFRRFLETLPYKPKTRPDAPKRP